MPEIRALSSSLVNKIAAGEVIERPASVVKELLENAVDAGATRIDVTVEQGGSQLIRISDNGCGIAADQLALAVTSHATSKIRSADDLFRIGTLGFRGEALASIAEVSQFRLVSRETDATAGAELEVNAGEMEPAVPCGCPVGTVIEARNLFFNTPVRRKFMRTTQTEMGHVSEAFSRIALAHPDIHFSLQHNQRSLFDLPATKDWQGRIATLFGREVADSLIWVAGDDGPVRLRGFVANPSLSRGNNRMQYLFLNGRFIRDRSLAHALGEAYRGLLMTGRHSVVFLRLEVEPETVDVNVHPTKLEVRFQDSGQVYRQLLSTLRARFLSTDLTARADSVNDSGGDVMPATDTREPHHAARQREQLVEWARRPPTADSPTYGPPAEPAKEQASLGLEFSRAHASFPSSDERAAVDVPRSHESGPQPSGEPPPPVGVTTAGCPALQVHNRYLITETDEGVVVIDQHALHERILYEELREKMEAGELETQSLLVPEPVRLTPAEAAAVLDATELFHELGIDVAPFGGDTVLVSSYPAMLANIRPDELLKQLVEKLTSTGQSPDRRDLLDELLHMISCKAAIKAGDRLSREEISALIERRGLVQDSHHCPHGRPTALVFTREELDRRFKRI